MIRSRVVAECTYVDSVAPSGIFCTFEGQVDVEGVYVVAGPDTSFEWPCPCCGTENDVLIPDDEFVPDHRIEAFA